MHLRHPFLKRNALVFLEAAVGGFEQRNGQTLDLISCINENPATHAVLKFVSRWQTE